MHKIIPEIEFRMGYNKFMINSPESGGGKMEPLRRVGGVAKKVAGSVAGGTLGAIHLSTSAVDNKYVRGGARLAYGLGRSSLETWVHNFDPRRRGDKLDKVLWGAGIGVAFGESYLAAHFGPAGGWMKAGINFAAVQGVSIGFAKYFERQEKNFIASSERANAVFADRANVVSDVDTELARIQKRRTGDRANTVSDVDTKLAEIQRRRAVGARRLSNFFAGVSAGNSIASIVHLGDLGLLHFAGTDNLGELFGKALEAHSANSAATTAAAAVQSTTEEAAATSLAPPPPSPEALAPHPSPPHIDIVTEAGLQPSQKAVFDTLKNSNAIAGAARDMMSGYGDYLSAGVDETQMGGVGQELVNQIMQTNHLQEASRIQVEAMVKKVVENQANQAFADAILQGGEANMATVKSGVSILKSYLEAPVFQQSLAENASRRFAQTIQEIATNPEAFQPADIAHLSGVSDIQAVAIANKVVNQTPAAFHGYDFSTLTELEHSNVRQAVFESIAHDTAPKLIEQSKVIESLPLGQAMSKVAEVGKHLPAREIAENLSQEFKNITGVLAQLTDTQLDQLEKVLNSVSTPPIDRMEALKAILGENAGDLAVTALSGIVVGNAIMLIVVDIIKKRIRTRRRRGGGGPLPPPPPPGVTP